MAELILFTVTASMIVHENQASEGHQLLKHMQFLNYMMLGLTIRFLWRLFREYFWGGRRKVQFWNIVDLVSQALLVVIAFLNIWKPLTSYNAILHCVESQLLMCVCIWMHLSFTDLLNPKVDFRTPIKFFFAF